MAIKNTVLGGTDWTDGQILYSVDLNDTYNAAASDAEKLNPWIPSSAGIANAGVFCGFAGFTSTTWISMDSGLSSVRRTTDGGLTWATISLATAAREIARVFGSATHAIVFETGAKTMSYTSDAGATFTPSGAAPASFTLIHMMSMPTTTLAVMCGTVTSLRSIAYSTNNGAAWTVATSGPTVGTFAIAMLDATTGFAVDSANNVWKTTNGGVDWTDTTHDISGISSTAGRNGIIALTSTSFIYFDNLGSVWKYNNATVTTPTIQFSTTSAAAGFLFGPVKLTNGYIYAAVIGSATGVQGTGLLMRTKDTGTSWQVRPITLGLSGASTYSSISEIGTNVLGVGQKLANSSILKFDETRE